MKAIIAGSRSITRHGLVRAAIVRSGWADSITEVVSGCARGVDQIGELWAREKGVPVRPFPADWNAHGKAAGLLRNEQMAVYADALIAVWDGVSRGTADMIDRARQHGLAVYVHKEANMKVVELPPITAADQHDLFAERTLVCGGCGITFTTTNPKTQRCYECNAGLKVKVVCPACLVETTIGLLAPHKLCACCLTDLVLTKMSLESTLNGAQCRADEAWLRLDADLAHADVSDRARYDAACEKAAEWSADRWARARDAAIAKGDGLSPLLSARAAWDDAVAALDRVRAEVELGLAEVERAKEGR